MHKIILLSGTSYDASAKALFDAWDVAGVSASQQRKKIENAYIKRLKNAGIWSGLDILYVLASHAEGADLFNWKNPALFKLTPTATAPAFEVNKGRTGNGTDQRFTTGWNPTANGVNYLQNSASIWDWSFSDIAANAKGDIGWVGSSNSFINPRNAAGDFGARINDETNLSATNANSLGFYGAQRRSNTDKRGYKNGAQIGTTATTNSTGLPNDEQWVCGANSSQFSARQVGFAAWGGPLTGLEAEFYAATLERMQAIGAA